MNKAASFTIGRVTGVHGLNGNLKVWSFAESVDTFYPGKIVLLKSEEALESMGKPYTILKADTWYWQDLLGLDVFDHQKGFIGKITDIFPTGANDMLVVMDKTRETLVPMHKHFVESIDIEKNAVKTTLPPEPMACQPSTSRRSSETARWSSCCSSSGRTPTA